MKINLEHGGSGVYILRVRGDIIYVGRSHHVPSRLAGHSEKQYDSVEIIWCSIPESYRLEKELIAKYRPPFNVKDNPNILRKFIRKGKVKDEPTVAIGPNIPLRLSNSLNLDAKTFSKTKDGIISLALELLLKLPKRERAKLYEQLPNKILGRPI